MCASRSVGCGGLELEWRLEGGQAGGSSRHFPAESMVVVVVGARENCQRAWWSLLAEIRVDAAAKMRGRRIECVAARCIGIDLRGFD